ncbi:MAG: hypothetical protein IKT98_06325 [Selenomonadaceae bacterium]|nr:hypothetical protein [Selenomonadaceae bacterium]
MTIADKGGTVTYNDVEVANNAAINDLNSSKSGASFGNIKIADANQIPKIKVSNTYAGQSSIPMKVNPKSAGYNELPNNAKNATYKYTPINYIEVTKDIKNLVGKVELNNNQCSIRIISGANVNAKDITMTAKESISQGYTDGIVNIGYTPEYAYADEAKKLRNKTGWDKTIPESDGKQTYASNTLYKGGTGRIAGDAIYIAARDININGFIQIVDSAQDKLSEYSSGQTRTVENIRRGSLTIQRAKLQSTTDFQSVNS